LERRCNFADCAKRSALALGDQEYCAGHFIVTSYQRLEKSQELRERDAQNEVLREAQKLSLLEIIERATAGSQSTSELTELERSQLLDVVLWASELVRWERRGLS
jgi:hypothetical protein